MSTTRSVYLISPSSSGLGLEEASSQTTRAMLSKSRTMRDLPHEVSAVYTLVRDVLSLCKDVKDETGDVQCTILVQRNGVWGNGGSVSLDSLVRANCNHKSCTWIAYSSRLYINHISDHSNCVLACSGRMKTCV